MTYGDIIPVKTIQANHEITRRQFLQASAAAGLMLSSPGLAGGASLPSYTQIRTDEGKALILTNCNIVDVVSGEHLRSKIIVVRRGFIESVSDRMPAPQEGQVVYDLKNRYVIPGLIDAHCHTTLTSEAGLDLFGLFASYAQHKRNFIQQLMHGVTTVRDMGAMPKLLAMTLEMIANDEVIGPRVVFCNAFTNIDGGHPDIAPDDVSIFSGLTMMLTGNPYMYFKDMAELKEKLPLNTAGGASFIKLTMDRQSLMCGRGAIPVYSDEHLRVIMDYAQSRNLTTAGHVHTKFGFDRSLQFGLGSIEHMISDARLTDQEIQKMADKKIAIVPTMIVAQMMAAPEAYPELPAAYRTEFIAREIQMRRQYLESCTALDVEPGIHRANMASLQYFQKFGCENLYRKGIFLPRPDLYFNILLGGPDNLSRMKQAGVLIGCGTDSGVPFMYHGSLWREMELLGRIGFTNKEILQCATIQNARILRMADKIGTIEKGKFADMAVLNDNPLDRIEACRMPELVIKEGRIYAPAGKA